MTDQEAVDTHNRNIQIAVHQGTSSGHFQARVIHDHKGTHFQTHILLYHRGSNPATVRPAHHLRVVTPRPQPLRENKIFKKISKILNETIIIPRATIPSQEELDGQVLVIRKKSRAKFSKPSHLKGNPSPTKGIKRGTPKNAVYDTVGYDDGSRKIKK